MRYQCLVLDHDDTVVNSTASVQTAVLNDGLPGTFIRVPAFVGRLFVQVPVEEY